MKIKTQGSCFIDYLTISDVAKASCTHPSKLFSVSRLGRLISSDADWLPIEGSGALQ